MNKNQLKIIAEIISFYDHPWMARKIIDRAIEAGSPFFRGEESMSRLLWSEKRAYKIRKDAGSKSPEVLLSLALDRSYVRDESLPGASPLGFQYLRWQEEVGPC